MDNQPIILISKIGCFPYFTWRQLTSPIHPLLFFKKMLKGGECFYFRLVWSTGLEHHAAAARYR